MATNRSSTTFSGRAAAAGDPATRRGRGRPRAEGIDERVLAAARAIEAEVGYDATSVEAIAERAGVAKTAIYRRWPNKGALLYEAVLGRVEAHPDIPDTGRVRADLLAVLTANAAGFRSPTARGLVAALSADALTDPRLAAILRERFFGPRADAIVARVEAAIARGELLPSVDPGMVPVLLTGSLQYLWLVRGSQLDDADLARVVDAVLGPHLPR